jgi:trk system potassium uptake protein TrkA
MLVLIVGGGKVGAHLASIMHQSGYDVRLVESRPHVLTKLHRELPTEVIVAGDGTDIETLLAAGIAQADVFAACASEDEVNLVAISIARLQFNVPRIIVRVNDAKNNWLFTPDIGADVVINQADFMAKLILEEMSLGDMMTLLKLKQGEVAVVEEVISKGAPADGMAVKDIALPEECTLAAVIRQGEVITVRGNTVLQAGDEVLAIVRDGQQRDLSHLLSGR